MKIPIYSAKSDDSYDWYKGFYFAYPATTHCFNVDPKVKIKHCIAFWKPTDWGLPNDPCIATIDPTTLKQVGEVDSETVYWDEEGEW